MRRPISRFRRLDAVLLAGLIWAQEIRRVELFLLFAVLFASPALAQATNVYLTPSGTATGSCPAGTASAPNLTPAQFNTGDNWGTGAGKIGAGTTVLMCGTFNAPAGSSKYLSFQGGGSPTNPITLLFDTNAQLTATYWSGPAIFSTGFSYITVDGGTNGIIQATANGTNLANQQDHGSGVALFTGNFMTVKNLTVANLYIRTCTLPVTNCTDINGGETGGIAVTNGSNLTIANNICHDVHWCFGFSDAYSGGAPLTNIQIYGNTAYNMDHGVFGDLALTSGQVSNFLIYGNTIHDWANWDSAKNYYHHDGIHVYQYSTTAPLTGEMIYDNCIYGNPGVGINAWIFNEAGSGEAYISAPEVFNNVLVDNGTIAHAGNGFLSIDGANPLIANNTIIGAGVKISSGGILWTGMNATIENNTIQSASTAMVYKASNYATIDYNSYYNIGSGGWNNESFLSWRTSCSCDPHSTSNTNPNLNSNYQPTASSTAIIKQGQNLNNLSISALDVDFSGVARPGAGPCSALGSSSCWDIGAYQYSTAMPLALTTGCARSSSPAN